jgi:hypothetical protein
VLGPLTQQRRGRHRDVRAGGERLDDVGAGVDAGRRGEGGVDTPPQDRHPTQRQAQLIGGRQAEPGSDRQRREVDVGLDEPVEAHQPGRAGVDELAGEAGERRPVGGELDGHRDGRGARDRLDELEGLGLDLPPGEFDVRGHPVDVELDGVRTRVGQHRGVPGPPAPGHAVEARDDGDRHGLLGLPQQRHVPDRPGVVAVDVRGVARRRLGVDAVPRDAGAGELARLVIDLLLEQAREHHRADAGGVHGPQRRQVAGQRARGRHERAAQLEPQVAGGQVGRTEGFRPARDHPAGTGEQLGPGLLVTVPRGLVGSLVHASTSAGVSRSGAVPATTRSTPASWR